MPERKFTERRKRPDWMIRGATILCVIAWFLTVGALLLLDVASPTAENLITHMLDSTERDVWNELFLLITYALLILSLLSCVCAFIFNMLRMRRKTDKYKKSIIVIGLLTLVAFVIFMVVFGGQLF